MVFQAGPLGGNYRLAEVMRWGLHDRISTLVRRGPGASLLSLPLPWFLVNARGRLSENTERRQQCARQEESPGLDLARLKPPLGSHPPESCCDGNSNCQPDWSKQAMVKHTSGCFWQGCLDCEGSDLINGLSP